MQVKDNTNEVLRHIAEAKARALYRIGEQMVTDWREEITRQNIIDTGNFKRQTDHEEGPDYTIIGDRADYAKYLEYGTRKMRARPSLKPTIMNGKDKMQAILQEEFKR